MNAFERLIAFLGQSAKTPDFYGPFHIISVLFIIGACALAVIYRKKISSALLWRIILIFGCVMAVLEIYKQLIITYNPTNDTWVYEWYAFPFQFCSTPTYITLLAFLFYKLDCKKIYNAMLGFLATYSLIAGFMVVFIGTQNVLCPYIGINVQTMVHHGLMVVLGVIILVTRSVKFDKKTFVYSTLVFLPLLFIAMILNAAMPQLDLFYVSTTSTVAFKPISDLLFGGNLPYIIYLCGYILLFAGASALTLFIASKISKCQKNC